MNYLKFIFAFFCISCFSQKKYYNFSIIDGSKMLTMKQTNQLAQESNRLFGNLVIKDKKSEKYFFLGTLLTSSLILQPVTHEEGHRSMLTENNIGSISQPIFDKNMVAKVVGVTDATLKNLRDTNLSTYIRLHTAGLESDFTYLNSLNSKLSFEEEEYKYVKGDVLARNLGVSLYYLTSFINRKFSLDEFKSPELERDIVGHDIWGMIRHINRPDMEFHRYTTWDELTSKEKKMANRIAFFSLVNFLNPNLIGIRNYTLKNGNKLGFNIGYSLAPFGEYFQQNVYYYIPNKKLKLNPYLIEYFNNEKVFLAGGIKLVNYEIHPKILLNSSLDVWSQPENLSYISSKGKLGAGVHINGAYKILDINEGKSKSLFVNLGFSAKSKGFIPEAPSLKEDFRINMGIIYVIQ